MVVTDSGSRMQRRDANGRFRASGDPPARPVQVWLKPDVLERLDAYCNLYGVGRGRAIGHLLQGALPDPRWLPAGTVLMDPPEQGDAAEPRLTGTGDVASSTAVEPGNDPELFALAAKPHPQPLFQPGDRVMNNQGVRSGHVVDELILWVAPARLADGTLRSGHWSYAVAWDGQAGLTIRYDEDLLQPAPQRNDAG